MQLQYCLRCRPEHSLKDGECHPDDDEPTDPITCPDGQVLENNECVDRPECEYIPHFHELCDGGCGTFHVHGEDLPICTGCKYDSHHGDVYHVRG